jgi:hypothetical protein
MLAPSMGESSRRAIGAAALLTGAAALVLACASAPAQRTSLAAQASARDPGALPSPALFRRTSTVRSSHVEAELVRRGGGEWVIVRLEPQALGGGASAAPAPRANLADAGLEELLQAYERAFESRDEAGLAQVWLMNPSERHHVGRMFRESDGISVAISDPVVQVDGDRARLEFDQRFSLVRAPRISRAFGNAYRRALAASDAVGNWALESLGTD